MSVRRRLAAANPETLVTGLDRNPELLSIARRRAEPPNLRWVEADLAALALPAGSFDAIRTERVLETVGETLHASLPQPPAGRRIPGLLTEHGLRDVTATPFSFALDEPVWRKIVKDTVTAAAPPDPAIYAWLREQAAAASRGEFVAAFGGVLTTARRP